MAYDSRAAVVGAIRTGCHGDEAERETRLAALRFAAVRTGTRFRKLVYSKCMCIAVWIPHTEL